MWNRFHTMNTLSEHNNNAIHNETHNFIEKIEHSKSAHLRKSHFYIKSSTRQTYSIE
jgi:hypothetical protein